MSSSPNPQPESSTQEVIAGLVERVTFHNRASTMQLVSRENEFLRTGIDADWVYGYDAWHAVLS